MTRSIYTTGGTVQAGGGIYLSRKADDELLQLCREGQFAYVLTSRQMGKSSLMVQTAARLENQGITSVIIDLTKIGTNVTPEQWYLGVLTEIDESLMLDTDIFDWWEDHNHLGVTQRLTRFFEEILLNEVEGRIVLFVDEIDTTLSLKFTDDFFIAIRYFYTVRAQKKQLGRLSVVLIGVASPGELIKDPKRTPFNIGKRVELRDFSFEEAQPLVTGFKIPFHETNQLLKWIFHWTNGHPYLTQRLCHHISHRSFLEGINKNIVNTIASDIFLQEKTSLDTNIEFVRDMLTKRSPNVIETLNTYLKIIKENRTSILDEEQNILKSHLKLSGIVVSHNQQLRIRNLIYKKVFNKHWVRTTLANEMPPVQGVSYSALANALIIIILKFLGVFVPLELYFYDTVTRLSVQKAQPLENIIVVGITEADIRDYNQWPLNDNTVAELLERLQSYKPTVIGLDLVRDIEHPPGQERLARQLAINNVYGIYDVGLVPTRTISAPEGMNPSRTGFADFVADTDGVIRRNFMFASIKPDEFYALGLQLSLHFLREHYGSNIFHKSSEGLTIADTFFPTLAPNTGGYQNNEDMTGYQVMLQYQIKNEAIRQVSLTDVLENNVDSAWFENKVVLIGTVAPSIKDTLLTSLNTQSGSFSRTPGVILHAHAVTQILSSVLDKKPLIRTTPESLEISLVFICSIFGSFILRNFIQKQRDGVFLILGGTCLIVSIYSVALIYFYLWIPVVPSALAWATLTYQWQFEKDKS
ncbi:CHASE2 domain-containing protein [Leptothoe sp. ISB3NOV94-8A]